MKITPTLDRVLVRERKEQETKSGLHIPETAQQQDKTFEVIAVGPNVTGIKAGALVILRESKATAVQGGHIVSADDIVAIITPELGVVP